MTTFHTTTADDDFVRFTEKEELRNAVDVYMKGPTPKPKPVVVNTTITAAELPMADIGGGRRGVRRHLKEVEQKETGKQPEEAAADKDEPKDVPPPAPSTAPTAAGRTYEEVLATYGPIETWHVEHVVRFENLFNAKRNPLAKDFNADLSQWNLRTAEYCHDMFQGAEAFDTDVSGWNIQFVKRFNGMFNGATSFRGIGLDKWNVGDGESFMVMFNGCTSLEAPDLSGWDMTRATSMKNMFLDSSFGMGGTPNDLCAWRSQIGPDVDLQGVFRGTQCPDVSDPIPTDGATSFCSVCDTASPTFTPAPTPLASASPTLQPTVTGQPTSFAERKKPNVLLITTDQQKFDAIRRVQDERDDYEGTTKVRTPNLDRLSRQGAWFSNAYSQMAVCAPARSVLRTGCTVERTGIQYNEVIEEVEYTKNELFQNKIETIDTIDQILVEKHGYISEYYGKWHLPERWYNFKNQSGQAITYNTYNYQAEKFEFRMATDLQRMRSNLRYFEEAGIISSAVGKGEQRDTFTNFPYKPIVKLDSRHKSDKEVSLTEEHGFEKYQIGQSNVLGNYSLSEEYTPSRFNGEIPIKALDRLMKQDRSWLMTVNFHNPHAPMVPAWKYLQHYWQNRKDLYVSPSITDDRDNTAYTGRKDLDDLKGTNDPEKIKEMTAVYYALIEEVDHWIGKIVDKLGDAIEDTLIIFTTDHGEHMGSHGRLGKNTFYEEASRVPMFMMYPKRIPANTVVDEKVSHLDIFATIMDYVEVKEDDHSDGMSLRPMIEKKNYNADFDEDVVVTEWDARAMLDDGSGLAPVSGKPSIMVRKGDYKLMTFKFSDHNAIDMLINLKEDPYELNNLVGRNGDNASTEDLSKAEHLRCLLAEWMRRMDGEEGYFSNPIHNFGEGEGDIVEVLKRQAWRPLGFWISDTQIDFGVPATIDSGLVIRNEYLYMGTRTEAAGQRISLIVDGPHADMFKLQNNEAFLVEKNQCLRVKISFIPPVGAVPGSTATARMRIRRSGRIDKEVMLSATIPPPQDGRTTELENQEGGPTFPPTTLEEASFLRLFPSYLWDWARGNE